MWKRPALESTLENLVFSRVLGEYKHEDYLAIYLDVNHLKEIGIYDEVKAHEWTHLQLTTSTTLGHALQFLAASRLRRLDGYKDLYSALMLGSWEAQEGAATVTEWTVAEATRLGPSIDQFCSSMPSSYQVAFDIFNTTLQIMLAPDCYWMKSIAANALAQFALNIDIMPRLIALVAQSSTTTRDAAIGEFLNSEIGHPQKRIRRVMVECGSPYSTLRELRCGQIYERLEETLRLLQSKFPEFFNGCEYLIADAPLESRMLVNDEINQTFLRYFVDITGLPVSVYHAKDAGMQFDALCEAFEIRTGIPFHRIDMSGDIARRASFTPTVRTLFIP